MRQALNMGAILRALRCLGGAPESVVIQSFYAGLVSDLLEVVDPERFHAAVTSGLEAARSCEDVL